VNLNDCGLRIADCGLKKLEWDFNPYQFLDLRFMISDLRIHPLLNGKISRSFLFRRGLLLVDLVKENKMGSTPSREPKTAANDDQPLLPVYLIDGAPKTCWCSRGQTQPDVEDVWIRIDLPKESCVTSVTLVPLFRGLPDHDRPHHGRGCPGVMKAGQGIPKHLTIKLSRDAWHWETVYEDDNFVPSHETAPQEQNKASNPGEICFLSPN